MEQFLDVCSQLASGFIPAFVLFFFTLILSLPLGLLMSFCTMSRFAPLRIPMKLIVWVLRGTPLLLQIFTLIYLPGILTNGWFQWPSFNTDLALLQGICSAKFIAIVVAFIINYAAYFSEIFRGGIQSIPQGQYEAGQVLGMTKRETFFKVVLLQVVKRTLAPISNEAITLIKDTSLVNAFGIQEILFWANTFMLQGLLWPLFAAGGFYLLFVGLLTILFGKLEKKLSYFKA